MSTRDSKLKVSELLNKMLFLHKMIRGPMVTIGRLGGNSSLCPQVQSRIYGAKLEQTFLGIDLMLDRNLQEEDDFSQISEIKTISITGIEVRQQHP